jgi:hypothetical protein
MFSMKKIIVFSTIIIALFASCKKDDSVPSKMDLLTDKPWIMQKYEGRTLPSTVWTDYFTTWIPACERDDKWIFSKNQGLELNENANACSGSVPNDVKDVFNWNFSNNDTQLSFDGFDFTIDLLDESHLELSRLTTVAGITSELKITYGH